MDDTGPVSIFIELSPAIRRSAKAIPFFFSWCRMTITPSPIWTTILHLTVSSLRPGDTCLLLNRVVPVSTAGGIVTYTRS